MNINTSVNLILEALTLGAQAVANEIRDEEIKNLYYFIKNRISEKWVGEPNAEMVIAEYSKGSSSIAEPVLSQKLQESGVAEDSHFIAECERLIKLLSSSNSQDISIRQDIDAKRYKSPGDTAIDGGIVDKSSQQNFIENKQSRLAILFGVIALALAGLVGYLYKSGDLHKIAPGIFSAPTCDANSNSDCVNNVEVRLAGRRTGGDPRMEGTAHNSGKEIIDRFHIAVVISKFSIKPVGLSNSKVVQVLDTVNNLKPGETRPVSGSLNLENSWVEDMPEEFKGKNFNYTIYWGDEFHTSYFQVSTKQLQICQQAKNCSKLAK